MPTPSGMLKAGDLIQHKTSKDIIEVLERIGNDRNYSVRARMKQRGPGSTGVPSVHIAPDMTWLMTEVAWWMQQGVYKLVDETALHPEHQCENMKMKKEWPYVARCRDMGATRREVLVGKSAGIWDPIYETHYICDDCCKTVDTKPEPDPNEV